MFKMRSKRRVKVIILGSLIVLAVMDVYRKVLPLSLLIGLIICALVYVWEIPYGALPGIFMLGISLASHEAIGIGDCLVIIALGICIGFVMILYVICLALFACACINMVRLIYHRIKKKERIAFVPYIAMAYLGVLIIG